MTREKLPMQLEIISNLLNNKEVVKTLEDVEEKMTIPQLNARIVKIMAIAMRTNPKDMTTLVSLHSGKSEKEVQELSDKEFATILRESITSDVLGFFG